MRGRWASAAVGAGIARRRAGAAADQQVQAADQANQIEMEKMKASYQHEIDQMKAAQAPAPQPQQSSGGQEDITAKIRKLGELKQQGLLSEEEFQKAKADLIAKL
jgi:putative oligomerization/nucleic acid binding protein